MRKSTKSILKYTLVVVIFLTCVPILLQRLSPDNGQLQQIGRETNIKDHAIAAVAPVAPHLVQHIDYASLPKKDWHDYARIKSDAARTGPGEQGRPYILSPEEKKNEHQDFSKHGFNKHISDVLSVERALPDIRDPRCKTMEYLVKLPNTSIVIPFHNEALSVLKRTVHSIINRSPPELLHEIILVDDFSDHDECKEPLNDYMVTVPKVRIIRATKREGLIRTRLLGASRATGQVLVFLDSHCEANVNWLPPLLESIALNRKCIACPMIDVIGNNDYHYETQAGDAMRGAFDWELFYKRIPLTEEELKRRKHAAEPFRTPIMAGGLFAVDRLYFNEIGGYDAGLEIWGGEQYDLSFKVWMCGGEMVDVPCSRVGHIYRKFSPYSFPGGSANKNLLRVVEVWMDEYKKYFYKRRPHLKGQDFGDISAQLALKKKLNCKSFKWFLEEVGPDILKYYPPEEPEPAAWGAIKNVAKDVCLDGSHGNEGMRLKAKMCLATNERESSDQNFQLTWHDDLRPGKRKNCLDVASSAVGTAVTFYPCHGQHGNQHWKYYQDKGQLYHPISGKCLEFSSKSNSEDVYMANCNEQELNQHWQFAHFNSSRLDEINKNSR